MANRYAVAVIGFVEQENKLFEFTLGVSQRRSIQYALTQEAAHADILIIDSAALAAQRDIYLTHLNAGNPIIIVGGLNIAYSGERLDRPMRWMRLFDVLDAQVTAAGKKRASTATVATLSVAHIEKQSPTVLPLDVSPRQASVAPVRDCVLVVDDSPAVRQYMSKRLMSFSVEVDFAETGEQAIAKIATKKYLAVFLDVVLPGADGYQVCRMIRSAKNTYQPVVIMLTSRDSAFDKIRGKMVGCTAYLTKPVDDELLFETFRKFLPAQELANTYQLMAN